MPLTDISRVTTAIGLLIRQALARDVDLQRQPEILRKIQAALDPYNPYDWR